MQAFRREADVIDEFKQEHGVDLGEDKTALQRVKEAAEKAKCELSTSMETSINLPFIWSDEKKGPMHIDMRLTRSKLESLVAGSTLRTIGSNVAVEPGVIPKPVMSYAVSPRSSQDEEKLSTALQRAAEDDVGELADGRKRQPTLEVVLSERDQR